MPAEEMSLMSILLLLSKMSQKVQSTMTSMMISNRNMISGRIPIIFTYEIFLKKIP